MMKKLGFVVLAIVMMQSVFAQKKGIQFIRGKSWNEILAQAQKENKYVFVDAFTTWCGPCKYMSNVVFTDEELGNFFSAKFISVSYQLDSTKKDDELTKRQYAEAAQLVKKYKINSYPTLLYFTPKGELMDKLLTACEVETFLAFSKKAINPDSAFYVLKGKFDKGTIKDPSDLYNLAIEASRLQDKGLSAYALKYIRTQKDMMNETNIQFLKKTTKQLSDTGLKIIVANEEVIDAKLKIGATNDLVVRTLFNSKLSEFEKLIKAGLEPNWTNIEKEFTVTYPKYSKLATLFAKALYYNQVKKLDKKINYTFEYLSTSPSSLDAGTLNEWAMSVYTGSMDKDLLNKALFISKKSLEDGEAAEFLDTYACILYKLGRTEEGIEWETKALSKATTDIDYYKKTIEQMKKGDKIWENQQ